LIVIPGVPTRKPRVKRLLCSRLAGAGGELQRETHQQRIGIMVGVGEVTKEVLARLASLGRDFGQPDGGLNGLDLTEERPDTSEIVMAPVLEESRRLRSDPPRGGIRQTSLR
jgi:hypothetical protein